MFAMIPGVSECLCARPAKKLCGKKAGTLAGSVTSSMPSLKRRDLVMTRVVEFNICGHESVGVWIETL